MSLSAAGSPHGKIFSMHYRTGPRVPADLEAAGLELNEVTRETLGNRGQSIATVLA